MISRFFVNTSRNLPQAIPIIIRHSHIDHFKPEVYMAHRKETLKDLAEWYPNQNCQPTHSVIRFIQSFKHLEKNQANQDERVQLCGRIESIRSLSKNLHFVDITGDSTWLQIKLSKQHFGDDVQDKVELLRRGDIASFRGFPSRTKAGELSLTAKSMTLLAPSLRILPTTNVGKRYRRRHLDFLVNPDLKKIFLTRSKVIKEIRAFLEEEDFFEVETPILWHNFGGALAKPFETYHHELEQKMYLRIAPELQLKQLIVGGFDRVFEIGKQFRNEGISHKHNPEFTTCEFYMAYANYKDVMSLTARMLRKIVRNLFGEEMLVPYTMKDRPIVLDFKSKFQRLDFFSSIESVLEKKLPNAEEINQDSPDTRRMLKAICDDIGLDSSHCSNSSKYLDKLFGHLVEPELVQPTIVQDFPQALSPLARPHHSKPGVAERFELYVAGKELVNAYSELNSPELQQQFFEKQLQLNRKDEVSEVDTNFVHALEHGLPPTGGFGLGIDRLVMILTNQQRIKDVILFPTVRAMDAMDKSDMDEIEE